MPFPPNRVVLNALLDNYINRRKTYWESPTGKLEAFGASIKSLFSTATSYVLPTSDTKNKTIEYKDIDTVSKQSKRTNECMELKTHTLEKLTTVSECVDAIIALGERATDIQNRKISSLSSRLPLGQEAVSLFSKYLHAERSIIIHSIQSDEKARTEFHKIIQQRKENLSKPEEKKYHNTHLLALAYLGDDESIQQATKESLLSMYTYPPPDYFTPKYSTTKNPLIKVYRPWCLQENFHIDFFNEIIKPGTDYKDFDDYVISVLAEAKKPPVTPTPPAATPPAGDEVGPVVSGLQPNLTSTTARLFGSGATLATLIPTSLTATPKPLVVDEKKTLPPPPQSTGKGSRSGKAKGQDTSAHGRSRSPSPAVR